MFIYKDILNIILGYKRDLDNHQNKINIHKELFDTFDFEYNFIVNMNNIRYLIDINKSSIIKNKKTNIIVVYTYLSSYYSDSYFSFDYNYLSVTNIQNGKLLISKHID